ncbi:Imidazoleglycerol-phosphate dehydratase [subsurface metagenome]
MNLIAAPPEEVVERVREYKNSNGYTGQQVAKLIGCSRPIYSQTVNGKIKVGKTFFYGAVRLLSSAAGVGRSSTIKRETKETNISLELNIDGSGKYEINNGISMFDHLLTQLARHGVFDIKLTAIGDDPHHLVEDVAICLGKAFGEALEDKRGIVRMAEATVPMDDALATAIVDISGRGYTVLDLSFAENDMFGFPTDLIRHFLESFAIEARLNLHAKVAYGTNDHHKAEALFKALGRALDTATKIDERISGELPSTKDLLEG